MAADGNPAHHAAAVAVSVVMSVTAQAVSMTIPASMSAAAIAAGVDRTAAIHAAGQAPKDAQAATGAVRTSIR